jgi:hypothetical protein
MTRRTTSTACLLLVLAAAPADALADNSFSIRVNSSWIGDSSFDVVSDNDLFAQAEFTFARRLLSFWRGEVWVDAAYVAGTAKSDLFDGQTKTRALLQNVTFGARYAYPVFSWLVPYSRLGLGVGVGTFELESVVGASTVQDRAAAFAGHFLLGVELLWPRRALLTGTSYLTAGILVEAGYGFGSRLGFDLTPEGDEDLKQIPLAGVDIGGLSTNGWQLRVGGILRF